MADITVATPPAAPATPSKGINPETINRNPVPDSEKIPETVERSFDSDFTYLRDTGKNGDTPTGTPATPAQQQPAVQPQTPQEQQKKIAVPPIAAQQTPSTPAAPATPVTPDTPAPTDWEKRYKDLQSFHSTTTDGLKQERDNLKVQLEQAQSALKAQESLIKEPLAFIAKLAPELAERINPHEYIVEKLEKEFGKDFRFAPEEAYDRETPSYKFRVREAELQEELRRNQTDAAARLQAQRAEQEARNNAAKAKVMKDYGLSEEQFNSEIVEYSKGVNFDWTMVADHKYRDWHIQQAVQAALEADRRERNAPSPKTPAALPGGQAPQVPENKQLNDAFGDIPV